MSKLKAHLNTIGILSCMILVAVALVFVVSYIPAAWIGPGLIIIGISIGLSGLYTMIYNSVKDNYNV